MYWRVPYVRNAYMHAGKSYSISSFVCLRSFDVNSNIEIARLLLSKNADINVEDAYGNNPLWTAVFNARGDYRMVELFIEYNANIHHLNKAGRSSLDFAKQIDDTKLVQILSK